MQTMNNSNSEITCIEKRDIITEAYTIHR